MLSYKKGEIAAKWAYKSLGAGGAGVFIEESSRIAVEVAGPGAELTAKADNNVPVTVSPAAL